MMLSKWVAAAALALSLGAAAEGYLNGTVTRVWDGDTVTIRTIDGDTEKVRLLGIDAPEKGQPGWRDSWSWLKRTINKRSVTIKWIGRDKTDSQRLLGTIYVAGENFNLLMVCRGWAWYYRQYASNLTPDEQSSYDACERKARSDRAGCSKPPTRSRLGLIGSGSSAPAARSRRRHPTDSATQTGVPGAAVAAEIK